MRTRRVRGNALLVTATTLALALAAGCSGGAGAASSGIEKPNLNVAVVPALDSAGFFVALNEGLFKAQGLNVTFTPATSSETVVAGQVQGEYDITGGNYVSYIQAQQSGQANLDIFAEGSVMGPGAQAIYTMPGSPVQTLAGLEKHTIAINAPKDILYLLTALVLAEHGIPIKTVNFANVAFADMVPDMQSGAISAAVMPEPFASDAEQNEGSVPLADLNQGATTAFPVEGYVVTKQWAAKYPHTLAAFYKALEEGQQIADTSRAAVEAAMENVPAPYGVSKQTAAVMDLDHYPVSTGPVGSVDKAQLQRVVDVMQQFIGFPSSFNINSMLMGGG